MLKSTLAFQSLFLETGSDMFSVRATTEWLSHSADVMRGDEVVVVVVARSTPAPVPLTHEMRGSVNTTHGQTNTGHVTGMAITH